ncbi:30S ribosomal protein S12 methylthiotransferase accessory factor YcaO [Gallaecimonas kandeliae]|uniref:30S ribosomal protein S12 methylthiotransferase accessory factor YcaO n=1 Tax=Gallaecimonas kandeliae TaxID=3029055 RepID=UPI002648CB50|nr:30S ribosomal protein S12 methylthiotransferase accessory factor YcaO [Gallaecimonas kandeliae]WKE64882.1 30S ribosomal protein S12 methylthiotransferase accessory factor YcaO [Gallaecimonas kandeliae]
MEKTFIPGKDAALEDSIARIGGAIQDLGFDIEEARWLNPAPFIWSVHIRDKDCPQVFSNGKGASREACLASAYGELIERLSTRYLWADFRLTPALEQFGHVHQADERWFDADGDWPEELLDEHCRAIYDSEGDLELADLIDHNGGDSGQGVCALPYVRQSDGKTVYVPVNLIGNIFVSNGMSAGNTREEAQVQGLSEIFERAIKNRIIVEDIALPEVPQAVLDRYPHIDAGIKALQAEGFGIRALDASLGGRYPVMCVVLQHPKDGGVYASFGAHPKFGVALERALTELLQGRALDELEGFPAPTTDMEQVTDPHNLELHFIDSSGYVGWGFLCDKPDFDFADWDDQHDNVFERQALIDLLHDEGHQVYVAEHTALGAYACRILVPGFSDIYPADELVWHNNNQALDFRPVLFDLKNATEDDWQELLEALDHYSVNDQLRVLEWAGIVGDKGTPWARLRIGELRLWLLLALDRREEAFEQLGSVLASGHLTDDERTLYRALFAVLELSLEGKELSQFERGLISYFGADKLALAKALASGEDRFPNLHALDPEHPTEGHRRLLEAYAKVLKGQLR